MESSREREWGRTQSGWGKGASYFCGLYKINKLQGYITQHRANSQYFIMAINGA